MAQLKIIKFVVFLLTFLLVLGMFFAATLVFQKTSRTASALKNVSLNQPQGSYIADYKFNDNTLYILLKGGNLPDRIAVIDPKSQESFSLITINKGAD